MIALDVNIIVSAFRRDAPDHNEMRHWLERAVNAHEPVGITDAILGAAVRILTNPRVFTPPTPLADALREATRLRAHAGTVTLAAGRQHWEVFTSLCEKADARGNLVADAQHAAVAVEHGASWVSKDRDFAKFPELRWKHPLD